MCKHGNISEPTLFDQQEPDRKVYAFGNEAECINDDKLSFANDGGKCGGKWAGEDGCCKVSGAGCDGCEGMDTSIMVYRKSRVEFLRKLSKEIRDDVAE